MTLFPQHPDAMDLAGFVDRSLDAVARVKVEAHLVTCAACRRELFEVEEISRGVRTRSRSPLVPVASLLAAAAALLLVLSPSRRPTPVSEQHREPAVTTTVAPRAVAPLGGVARLDSIRWSSVPGADRYSVSVFDANGTVLWQSVAADTVISVPPDMRLAPGDRFFWSVRARVGWDRWVESTLSEFTVLRGPGAP